MSAAAVNEYNVRANNLEKKVDEEELHGMDLLRELKRSKEEVERPKCETKLLQYTTEGMLESAVREVGTSPGYVDQLLEALAPQNFGLTMTVTQKSGVWCGEEMLDLKRFTMEKIWGCTGPCKKGCSRFAVQREWVGVVLVTAIVVARSGRQYLPSCSTESVAQEKILLKEMATENWCSVLVGGERRREVKLKLCNDRWVQGPLKQCLSDTSSKRIRVVRDSMFCMLGYDVLLSQSSGASESALLRKRGQFERARKALLRKIRDGEHYDMSCEEHAVICNWLKAGGMKESHNESEWRDKRQRFNNDGEGEEEYLELFGNKVGIRLVEEVLGFSARKRGGAGDVEGSIVWLALVDAWVATVVKYLTQPETLDVRGRRYMLTYKGRFWN